MQLGLDLTPENRKRVVLSTRKSKRDTGKQLEDLQEDWTEESKPYQLGTLSLDSPLELQVEPGLMKLELDSAIAHCSERSASFNESELYRYCFKFIKASKVEQQGLESEIQKHPSLIKTNKPGVFTTAEAVEREAQSVHLWMVGQGKAQPLKLDVKLEETSLNPGQAQVVRDTLACKDLHQIWPGFSGVGKTTTFRALKEELDGSNIVIRGYATTIAAAQELQAKVGIPAQTVQHLVLSKPESVPNQLWLVDEVGMLGAEDMLTMQRKAESVGARIIIAGDKRQNASIKAGSPLRSLIKHDATTHWLKKIIRQKNADQLRAVELIANGDGVAALALLKSKGYVTEIKDQADRANQLVQQYLALSPKERDQTFLVTGTNAERLRITKALRTGLKQEGLLSESVSVVQLVSHQFTDEQRRRIENYSEGDYIKLRRTYPGSTLVAGQLYKVEKRDGGELVVSSYGGRLYRFNPAKQKDKEVYYARDIEIAVGDQLRWTISDEKKGRANGRHLSVIAMGETTMTVQDVATQKTQEVSLLQPLPLDYDWVSTSYRAQGRTVKRVIVSATDDPTSCLEPFYVKISRQEYELSVYTQDIEKLEEWVSRSNAQENALDLIGEDDGSSTKPRPEAGLNSETACSDEGGARESKQRNARPAQRTHEHGTPGGPRRDAGVHSPVQRGARQPKTVRDGGVHQAPGQGHGGPGSETRKLGANSRSSGLVGGDSGGRNQGLQASSTQQRTESADAASNLTARYQGLDDLAQTDRTFATGESLINGELVERLEQLIERLKKPSHQAAKPVYEGMAELVQGEIAESDQSLLLDSTVLDGLGRLSERLESVIGVEPTPAYESLDDIVLAEGIETEIQLVLESGLLERLESLNQAISAQLQSAQAPAYEGLDEHVQLDLLEPDARLLSENRVIERLDQLAQRLDAAQTELYEGLDELVQLEQLEPDEQLLSEQRVIERLEGLAKRLDAAQTFNTASFYEGLGELTANETTDKEVQLLLESAILKRLQRLAYQLETTTGVQNDQIISYSANADTIESERPDSGATNLNQLAQSESGGHRAGVGETAPGIDERTTESIRSIAERISEAITGGHVEETIREFGRSCDEIISEYERVRLENEGRAGLKSALSGLIQSVHRLDQQLGQALRRERVSTIAGAIAEWRAEQELGQTIAQFNTVFESLGVDISQPSEITKELALTILENNAETELEAALVSLSQMLAQTQTQAMSRPDIQTLSEAITELQAEQDLVEAISQFDELIKVAKPAPQRTAAEALAQAVGDYWIEDELIASLTQLSETLTQVSTQVSPAVSLAEAITTANIETELIENLELVAEVLSQTTARHRIAPEIQQLAGLIDEWNAEGDLTQLIAQLTILMQSVSEAPSVSRPSVMAEDLAQTIAQANFEEEIAQTTARLNEALLQAMEPFRSRPEVMAMADAIESLQMADLEGEIAQSVERLADQIQTLGFTRPPNPQVTELAQRLLERRAEDVLAEHLAAFSEGTEIALAQIRQRPELAQLVETIQALSSDATLSDSSTGQQLKELSQRVQALDLDVTVPEQSKPPTVMPKPKKLEAFWVPDYSSARRPNFIEPKHWEEYKLSAIHPALISARFESIEGRQVFDRLFSDKFATMGAGQKSTRAMERMMDEFAKVAEGAWWYKAGKKVLDFPALAAGQKPIVSTGGSLKPNEENRREDTKKTLKKRARDPNAPTEYIKYENPVGPKQTLFERDLFFGDVPNEIAEGIYQKYGVTPSAEERAMGFWYVVYKHVEIPIYRVEGAKKDAATTSQGRAVIGGHGINAAYRANDLQDNKLERRLLHPQLEIFAQPGREFRFANDQDESVSTILNVRRDTVREAELLEERGCTTLNIKWDGKNERKGADDLIEKDGPLAFERADQNAYPMQREAIIYYRTQYNSLAKEVRKTKPSISGEALDIEVYLLAITKGELKDGERFLSQSDQARLLKDPAQVTAYIEHIKASIPQYLQQQQAEEQERKDRARYEEIAQSITAEMGALKPGPLDIEVCIRLTLEHPNLERILAQSDWARSRETPEAKHRYLQTVQTAALLTMQQRQTAKDRAEYEVLATRVRNDASHLSVEAIDMRVFIIAEEEGNLGDGNRLIIQSDYARTLSNLDQVQQYVTHIQTQAPQYIQQEVAGAQVKAAIAAREAQKLALQQAQRDRDRALYQSVVAQVTREFGNLPTAQLDAEVYLRTVESNGDRILKQSDHLQTLMSDKQETECLRYLEHIKTTAPEYRQTKLALVEEGRALIRLLPRECWTEDGEHRWVFQAGEYQFTLVANRLDVFSTTRNAFILVSEGKSLTGCLTEDDIEDFDAIVKVAVPEPGRERTAPSRPSAIQYQKQLNREVINEAKTLLALFRPSQPRGARRLENNSYIITEAPDRFTVQVVGTEATIQEVDGRIEGYAQLRDLKAIRHAIEFCIQDNQTSRADEWEVGD